MGPTAIDGFLTYPGFASPASGSLGDVVVVRDRMTEFVICLSSETQKVRSGLVVS